MSEHSGFWSERPRKGGDDASVLAMERLHAIRQMAYTELQARAGRDPEVEEVTGVDGDLFRRRTAVRRFTRGGGEELRVTIQVTKDSPLGRINPLAEISVTATPDGELVGDYTLAAEGDDPRRYTWGGD